MISITTSQNEILLNSENNNRTALTINLLKQSFDFLEEVITARLNGEFNIPYKYTSVAQAPLPGIEAYQYVPLGEFISRHGINRNELVVLLLALIPHIHPFFIDGLFQRNLPQAGDYPQFGGTRSKNFRGFLPTGETALYLLAGDDLQGRMQCQKIFDGSHIFAKANVLSLEDVPPGEPAMSGRIIISNEYLELFTTGRTGHPKFSMEFPAQHIITEMEWDDLVLSGNTMQQIYDLENWVKYHYVLMEEWGMKRKLKPGYRALFHGPPGTGKTLTATLLGKYTNKDVFRVDLSMVVSKFIGETEKNLSVLFNRAENKNWILFFDEADALFSKRTNVRDAHDKYANQEAAYLLQRIEAFDGLVILATNFKNNIDEAFIRRFQSVIHFDAPGPEERLELWKRSFPAKVELDASVDLDTIAKRYEVTGSAILSVVQYCCLQAISRNCAIGNELILDAIRKEYLKEGKIW